MTDHPIHVDYGGSVFLTGPFRFEHENMLENLGWIEEKEGLLKGHWHYDVPKDDVIL